MGSKELLFNLDQTELKKLITSWGEPTYRVNQLWRGIYKNYWCKVEEFSNIPNSLRETISEQFLFTHLQKVQDLFSQDGNTRKVLFKLPDESYIETVLMSYNDRITLCISSQAGCAMGCTFCATGQMGFQRHLSAGEIIDQVIYFSRLLAKENKRLTNIVLMGMGEPLHNYSATVEAIRRLNHPDGFNFGLRRFTVSTVGLVPQIEMLSQDLPQINLAVSLHTHDDSIRNSMVPVNKKYPLTDLLKTCEEHVIKTGRRITFEWALIKNINDSPQDATMLANLIGGINCHVNIIRLNPTSGFNQTAPNRYSAQVFRDVLEDNGIPCTIRVRRGIDIQAGCGQLASTQ